MMTQLIEMPSLYWSTQSCAVKARNVASKLVQLLKPDFR